MPPGTYCTTKELLLAPNVTLRGASMAGLDGRSATRIVARGLPPGGAAIRMRNRKIRNEGVTVENLSVTLTQSVPGLEGVDFSGVWYGAIRGVAVLGRVTAGHMNVASKGSIGFYFSDMDGDQEGGPCFANIVERTSAHAVTTGYKFVSNHGNTDLMTVDSFWTSDVVNGIWLQSIGGVGVTFRDGYLETGLKTKGKKAIKVSAHTVPSTVFMNVQHEFFDARSDLDVTPGFNVFGHSDLAHFEGTVSLREIHRTLAGAPNDVGAREDKPAPPKLYPGPGTMSFWAKIPAGTKLTAGENRFIYYTAFGSNRPKPLEGAYFTFHVTQNGGIPFPLSWSGRVTVTCPFKYDVQTYTVSLYSPTAFRLRSDLVFFLEVSQAGPTRP